MLTSIFLSMHPAPYRDPVLSTLQQGAGDLLDIVTLYPRTTHPEWDLAEPGYRALELPASRRAGSPLDLHTEILRVLSARDYECVIVPGYTPLTSIVAAVHAKAKRRRLVYSADTAYPGARRPRGALRHRVAAASADAIWTPGAAGRAFWESLGVPGDRVFEGMYTLDYEQVAAGVRAAELPAELAGALRGKFVYLFVGHFTPERRVPALVRAFRDAASSDCALLLIGQGPDLDEVTSLARRPGGQVCVVPGVRFDQLHAYYGRADAYVHPGGEPYSLALQEAAMVGLPLVSARSVGAAHDYLVPGVNGIWVDPGHQAGLESALRAVRRLDVPAWVSERARNRSVDFAVSQFSQMLARLA